MGRRRAARLQIELPVSVSGFDANGDPFAKTAKTVDVSWTGIRLRGVPDAPGPGEVVRVQYRDKRARYRIVWMDQGAGTLGLVGVEGPTPLFVDHLPPLTTDNDLDIYEVPATEIEPAAPLGHSSERRESERRAGERRRYKRFNCSGVAHVREENSQFAVEGRILDVSMSGCYVEMMSPMRVGAKVHIEVKLCGQMLSLPAIVRVSQLNMGMGLEFAVFPPGQREKLGQVITELSGEHGTGTFAALAAPPEQSQPAMVDPGEIGSAVLKWFATHDQLSREEFQKLLREKT